MRRSLWLILSFPNMHDAYKLGLACTKMQRMLCGEIDQTFMAGQVAALTEADRQRKLASTQQLTVRNLRSALGSMKQKRDKHAVKARNLQRQLDTLDDCVDAEAQYQIAAIAVEW
jgi:hypothetical protein